MKKIFQIAIGCLVLCVIASCGSKSSDELLSEITVSTSSGEVYKSYKECCEAQDFDAAAQYLAKMKKVIDTFNEKYAKEIDDWGSKERETSKTMEKLYQEAEKYIAHEEILFLIADGSKEAVDRLMFLRKQNKGTIISLDEILDLAQSQGNDYLIEKVLQEKLRMLSSSSKIPNIVSEGLHSDDIGVDGPECNERISKFNQECISLINEAVLYKKQDIAHKALWLMKPNIVTHAGYQTPVVDGVKVCWDCYYAQYVNNDINRAKKILEEAIKDGVFE